MISAKNSAGSRRIANAVGISSLFPAAILVCGTATLIRIRAFFVLHPLRTARILFSGGKSSGVGSWAALSVSLAGVLGVGNIAGVCVAMALGGPGAIFWMWVSALLSMPLKYAEVYLGVVSGSKAPQTDGSPMLYIAGLPHGRAAAALYAAVCILSAFTLGNITQTGAVAEALFNAFGAPRLAVGIAVALFSAVVITGRFEKLAKLTSAIVPFMSAAYMILCAAVIISGADRLPGAFVSIIKYAFTAGCASAGAVGHGVASAVRQGTLKGCFSHEAGSGTAVFAHTRSGASPEKQACFGIFEVFFDTTVICSLTAFAVLASGIDFSSFGYSGTECVLSAFEGALGARAGIAVSLCISLFAFATVLCWSSYGLTALRYFTHSRAAARVYLAVYCAAAVAGSVLRAKAVWMLTDASILSLTLINLTALMKRRREIFPPDLS